MLGRVLFKTVSQYIFLLGINCNHLILSTGCLEDFKNTGCAANSLWRTEKGANALNGCYVVIGLCSVARTGPTKVVGPSRDVYLNSFGTILEQFEYLGPNPKVGGL